MSDRRFFDTNVLVYAYDSSEPTKQRAAQELLREGLETGHASISAQVLGEFFVTVTRKIRHPLTVPEAAELLERLALLPIVAIDWPTIKQAVGVQERYGLSYWDSLVIAAAQRAGCARVISEDMNAGQSYEGVVVQNPFKGL
jgi:predicted nucleic acid-binding protein